MKKIIISILILFAGGTHSSSGIFYPQSLKKSWSSHQPPLCTIINDDQAPPNSGSREDDRTDIMI